ncbi:NLI interacting factor-like phosphatase [Giardia duodenalis]|uniref:protein-serine/threonine phosphatase n=1 Tax=Giardia intestinalis (strain ATCC 50803 / WB clone C6) TaxID=184922 RepID=A8BKA3_GIAIC|nr:NLI interacting factor-like phosphatase [Giardia intestinalis]KAE8301516.1 NLI interacting factor-like phosphatase [Giardia intestinalis]|eukprot:XP_001706489.1 Hypothetical protein GL50803_10190 [Giardia lamblia ATCC 50803]
MLARPCSHDLVAMQSLACIRCGQKLPHAEVVMHYQYRDGKFIRRENWLQQYKDAVLKSKKLILFLDIDNTILYAWGSVKGQPLQNIQRINSVNLSAHHAFRMSRDIVSKRASYASKSEYREAFLDVYLAEAEDFFCGCPERGLQPTAVEVQGLRMTIMFRPGIFRFFLKTYKTVAIIISTLGTQEYAQQVIKMIDPQRMLVYELLDRKLANRHGDASAEVTHDDEGGAVINFEGECGNLADQHLSDLDNHIMKGVNRFLGGIQLLIDNSIAIDNSSVPWRGTKCGFLKSFDFYVANGLDCFNYMWQQQVYPLESLTKVVTGYCKNDFTFLAQRNKPVYDHRFYTFSVAQLHSFKNILRYIQSSMHPEEFKQTDVLQCQSAREAVEEIMGKVLRGCVIYIPFLPNAADLVTEGPYIVAAQWKRKTETLMDFRVELIHLLGGRVAMTFDNEVTHVLVSESGSLWKKSYAKCAHLLLRCNPDEVSPGLVKAALGDWTDIQIRGNGTGDQDTSELFIVPDTFMCYDPGEINQTCTSVFPFHAVTQNWLMTSALLYRRQSELFYTRCFLARGLLPSKETPPRSSADRTGNKKDDYDGDTNCHEEGRPLG